MGLFNRKKKQMPGSRFAEELRLAIIGRQQRLADYLNGQLKRMSLRVVVFMLITAGLLALVYFSWLVIRVF